VSILPNEIVWALGTKVAMKEAEWFQRDIISTGNRRERFGWSKTVIVRLREKLTMFVKRR
jgi:hypothetical protein